MKVMLVNVLPEREVRIAIAKIGQGREPSILHDYYVENFARRSTTSNIYKAKVAAVNEQLQAAFIDYGDVKQGLLTLNKINGQHMFRTRNRNHENDTRISELLKEGDDILIQIDKDPRGDKGAAVTCFLQIQGQHVVLNAQRSKIQISRMITGAERIRVERLSQKLNLPNGMGVVIRTSARGKSQEVIQEDVDECVSLMKLIEQANQQSVAPRLLYEANNMVTEVLRDNLHSDIEKVFIDDMQIYREVLTFVKNFMPDFSGDIQNYTNDLPLFTKYRIENQTNIVFDRVLQLPSGGQIVLDPTEALLAIDVNSARSHYTDNFRELALKTNLEAAEMVFQQLRLRDIGGLIVIDFIDLYHDDDIKTLEDLVDKLCDLDRGRTRWEPLSQFGMMQLQRRRSKSSIYETDFEVCHFCGGHGYVRTIASVSHRIFREIEARCHGRHISLIRTHITKNVADFITTYLRSHITHIEMKSRAKLEFVLDQNRDDSTYTVEAFMHRKSKDPIQKRSYERGIPEGITNRNRKIIDRAKPASEIQQAAVVRPEVQRTAITPKPLPGRPQKKSTFMESLLKVLRFPVWITKRLFVVEAKSQQKRPKTKTKTKTKKPAVSKARTNQRKTTTKTKPHTGSRKSTTKHKAFASDRNAASIESKLKSNQKKQTKSQVPSGTKNKDKGKVAKATTKNPTKAEAPKRQKSKPRNKQPLETKVPPKDLQQTSQDSKNKRSKNKSRLGQGNKRKLAESSRKEQRVTEPQEVQKSNVQFSMAAPSSTPDRLPPTTPASTATNELPIFQFQEQAIEKTKPKIKFDERIKISTVDSSKPDNQKVRFDSDITDPPSNGDPDSVKKPNKSRAGNDPRTESRNSGGSSIVVS